MKAHELIVYFLVLSAQDEKKNKPMRLFKEKGQL
jgi:hypothetical protein